MSFQNSIDAPNYTQVPNIFFDKWCRVLKPSEFVLLMILARKTFGWHKSSDAISLSQLSKVTGLSKPTVIEAIEGLIKNGLVIKVSHHDDKGHHSNEFKLNIILPKDDTYSEEGIRGSQDSLPPLVKNSDQGVVKNFDTQKKPSPKERPTKEIPPLPPPSSDPEASTEEEEEILRRIKERPKKYGPIVSMKAWRGATLKDIRKSVSDQGVAKSVEKERRKEAQAYDMKLVKGFSICCCKEWVEVNHGQVPKFFRYDGTQQEWDQLPWRRK